MSPSLENRLVSGCLATVRDEAVRLLSMSDLADDAPRCSAKGCREPADIDLTWRNPSLHDATRVKHWLACGEHADGLADFLDRRGFLLGRAALP
jgi:hypothetical protein